MTIQQMEYIVAVDTHRHFVSAATACGVTQPTLSSMIQKLEAELDVTIFDRGSHPVKPTEMGAKLISQARVILHNCSGLRAIVQEERSSEVGSLRVAIIPTVAPYILPEFIAKIAEKHPLIELHISEMRTDFIIQNLLSAQIDLAILATPLLKDELLEIPLYYEKFIGYISPREPLYTEREIISTQMPSDHLWVLQEGHCLRGQVLNFCNDPKPRTTLYEAGSIDTLVRIVDKNSGYTIIPELHFNLLTPTQQANTRPLISPTVVREISIVVRKDFVKERMLNIVADTIKAIVPDEMVDRRLKKFAIRL